MLDMDEVAGLLTQPWIVYIFVLTILIVALRPFYQSIFSIKSVNEDLARATGVLLKLDRKHQQEEFFNHFKGINNQISKIEGLRHAWREFVHSLYFESATKKAYLSHRPSHYFHRESVLGKNLNLPQFLAYPNYLIGIGLTFTFIGLAAALHVAQAGLASGAGQQALKDLLAVASIKFISSIVGISSSLFISSLQRIRIRQFQQKLYAFCDLIEECTEYKSTEKLLHDNFHEQQKHTVILNNMPANIASAMGDVLGTHLSASVARSLDPLTQELRVLGERFTGNCEDALKKVLTEFLNQLRQNSFDDLQGLLASVRGLKEALTGLTEDMESVGKNFGTDTRESTVRFGEMLDHFTGTFAPVQQSIGQFGQALASLENVAGKIEQAGTSISGAAGDNQKSAAAFAGTMSEMAAGLAPLGEMVTGLSQSLVKVEGSALDLKTAGATIAAATTGFKASADAIGQAEGRFSQKSQTFESLAQGLSKAIAVLETATGQIGSATQPLGDISAGITQALRGLQETETKVQLNQKDLNTILVNLLKFAETIPMVMKQYEERAGKVDSDLGKSFGELARGSEEFRAGIQAFVKLLDEQFTPGNTAHAQKKDDSYFSKLKSKLKK